MFKLTAIYLIFVPTLINGFSFDTDFPIVYHDPFRKQNPTLYGFSIALKEGNISNAWIQIGAPKANSSLHKAVEPGFAQRCNILGDCNEINFDDGLKEFQLNNKYVNKKVDHALISSTMEIMGNRTVACAPRWVHNINNKQYPLIQGACYWSANSKYYHIIFPLIDEPRAKNRDGVETRYADIAEAGFSLHMINPKEFIIGAPGFSNYRGTVVRIRDKKRYFDDVKVVNPNKVDNLYSFSYNGYAVTAGTFFKTFGLQYVSSAPKRNYIGEAYVFNMNPSQHSGILNVTTIKGKQIGEYFGYSLTAGDINGDGFDDLVVGAPFYKTDKYNEGKIYVFFGKKKPPFDLPSKGAVIHGKVVGGQFGTCVMFLKDIDTDGFSDVAVGAPGEDDQRGIVYIFMGRRDGLHPEPAQKLYGSTINHNLKGFGYTISKSVDIDDNKFYDLGIGAYSSGHVVLLRSKKSIFLHQNITFLGPKRLTLRFTRFPIQICVWYTSAFPPPKITVLREIIVDPNHQRGQLENPSRKKNNLTIYESNPHCERLVIAPTINLNNAPFPITVNQKLIVTKPNKKILDIFKDTSSKNTIDVFDKELPVLNLNSQTETTEIIYYTTGCKSEDVCNTNLIIESKFPDLNHLNEFVIGNSTNLKLTLTIHNVGEKAYSTRIILNLPRTLYFSTLLSTCKELNESAVDCFVDNQIDENSSKRLLFDLDMSAVNKQSNLKKLLLQARVETSSNNVNTGEKEIPLNLKYEADVELTGSSEQEFVFNETTGHIVFSTLFKVQKYGSSPLNTLKLDMKIPTSLITISDVKKFLRIYSPDYSDNKQSIACFSTMEYYQKDNNHDDDFSNTIESIELKQQKTEELEDTDFNVTTEQPRIRKTRSLEENTKKSDDDDQLKKTYYLNCSNSQVECEKISCIMGPFINEKSRAMLQLKMIIDANKLSEIAGKHEIVLFSTFGKVEIVDPYRFVETGNRSNSVDVKVKFVGVKKKKIALWILAAAVLGGLLLLALTVVGLVKAGFFERADKRKLQALKAEEQRVTQQLIQDQMKGSVLG